VCPISTLIPSPLPPFSYFFPLKGSYGVFPFLVESEAPLGTSFYFPPLDGFTLPPLYRTGLSNSVIRNCPSASSKLSNGELFISPIIPFSDPPPLCQIFFFFSFFFSQPPSKFFFVRVYHTPLRRILISADFRSLLGRFFFSQPLSPAPFSVFSVGNQRLFFFFAFKTPPPTSPYEAFQSEGTLNTPPLLPCATFFRLWTFFFPLISSPV